MAQQKKIFILRGLPGSGKSQWTKEQLKYGKRQFRVNRDDMRAMLCNDICLDQREEVITEAINAMVEALLKSPKVDVIYNDNTNLSEKALQEWKAVSEKYNTQYEVIDFTFVPVETCIERDSKREKRVGRAVIERMALKAGLFDFKSHEKWLILDVDGTASSPMHRIHHVTGEKKNWPAFFAGVSADPVRHEIIAQVQEYIDKGVGVIVLSGRPCDVCGTQTEDWLTKHSIPHQHLFMRKAKDSRDDTIIKSEILDELLKYIPLENFVVAFDDRMRVIRLWKERGIPVIECGDGSEY